MQKIKETSLQIQKIVYDKNYLFSQAESADKETLRRSFSFYSGISPGIPGISQIEASFPADCPTGRERRKNMKEIFQEYGGIIITVVAIFAVIAVVIFVIGENDQSAIGKAFSALIKQFTDKANALADIS